MKSVTLTPTSKMTTFNISINGFSFMFFLFWTPLAEMQVEMWIVNGNMGICWIDKWHISIQIGNAMAVRYSLLILKILSIETSINRHNRKGFYYNNSWLSISIQKQILVAAFLWFPLSIFFFGKWKKKRIKQRQKAMHYETQIRFIFSHHIRRPRLNPTTYSDKNVIDFIRRAG